MAAAELLQLIAGQANQDEEGPSPPGQLALGDLAEPEPDPIIIEEVITNALQDMLADPEASFQHEGFLYQDFSVRCRMQKLRRVPLNLAAFRRRFAIAKGCRKMLRMWKWWNMCKRGARYRKRQGTDRQCA